MTVRSKSNYKSTKDLIITTNGVGDVSGADANSTWEDSADSFVFNNGTSTISLATWDGSYVSTSGVDTNLTIQPTVNQASGTGGSTALKINVITTALGSGVHNILQLQDTGTDMFLIDVDGTVTVTNKIVSISDGNIDIEPNGTGNVLLGNFTFDADQSVGAGQDNFVLTFDNGTGLISLEAASGGGAFTADGDTQITETAAIVLDQATGDEVALSISPTINKATSGNYTAIKVDVTETAAPGSSNLLMDLQVGSSTKFSIDNSGNTTSGKSTVSTGVNGGYSFGAGTALFYESASNTIKYRTGAVDRYSFETSAIQGISTGHFQIATGIQNSSTSPIWTFRGDFDTGTGRGSSNNLFLMTGGTKAIDIDSSQNLIFGGDQITLGASGLATASRDILVDGSETDIDISATTKGAGQFTLTTDGVPLFIQGTSGSQLAIVTSSGHNLSIIAGSGVSSVNGDDLLLKGGSAVDGVAGDVIITGGTESGSGTIGAVQIGTASSDLIGHYGATAVAQQVHIADATDAASAITQLNLLLGQFATLGLQASS